MLMSVQILLIARRRRLVACEKLWSILKFLRNLHLLSGNALLSAVTLHVYIMLAEHVESLNLAQFEENIGDVVDQCSLFLFQSNSRCELRSRLLCKQPFDRFCLALLPTGDSRLLPYRNMVRSRCANLPRCTSPARSGRRLFPATTYSDKAPVIEARHLRTQQNCAWSAKRHKQQVHRSTLRPKWTTTAKTLGPL